MKKKSILVGSALFAAGFLTHAIFFPDTLSNGFTDISNIVIPNNITPSGSAASANEDPLVTKIEFDGEHFSKHNVTIGYTRYIQIVNTSKTSGMSLASNMKELNTARPYAESEGIQTQFNTKGTFVVQDRNNPSEKLVILVK